MQNVSAVDDRFRLFSSPLLVHKVCCHFSEDPLPNGFRNAESFEDGTVILVIKHMFLTINLKLNNSTINFHAEKALLLL